MNEFLDNELWEQVSVDGPATTSDVTSGNILDDPVINSVIENRRDVTIPAGLTSNQMIAERARRITPSEIESYREEMKDRVGWFKRLRRGYNDALTDENIANQIATNQMYPDGVWEQSTEWEPPAWSKFGAGFTHNMRPFVELVISREDAKEFYSNMQVQPTGVAGGMGQLAGEVTTMLAYLLSGPVGFVLFTVKGAYQAGEAFRETDNVQVAVGTAFIEILTETIGAKGLVKIGESVAPILGSFIKSGNKKGVMGLLLGIFGSAAEQITEEELASLLDEANRYAAGVQTLDESISNFKQQFVPTAGISGGAGAILSVVAVFLPRRNRNIFLKALRDNDTQKVTEILEQAGTPQEEIVKVVEAMKMPERLIPEEKAPVDVVANEIKQSSREELQDSSDEIDITLTEPLISPEDRVILESVKNQINEQVKNTDWIEFEKSQETKPTKALLERIGLKVAEEATIKPSEALRAGLKAQQAAAQKADVRARQEEQVKTRERIVLMKARFKEQIADERLRAKDRKKLIRQYRESLVAYIKSNMPKKLRGDLLEMVRDVETKVTLEKGFNKVNEIMDAYYLKEATDSLENTIVKFKKDIRTFWPALRERMAEIVDTLDVKKLDAQKRQSLEKTWEYLLRNPESLMPKKVMEDLKRLSQTPVNQLSLDEVTEYDNILNHIMDMNSKRHQIIIRGQTRKFEKITEDINSELTKTLTPRPDTETGSIQREAEPGIRHIMLGVPENHMIRTLSEMLGGMGEDSVTYQVLYEAVDLAYSDMLQGHFNDQDYLADVLEGLGLELGGEKLASMSRELSMDISKFAQMFVGKDTTAELFPIELSNGKVIQLHQAEISYLLASVMDEDIHRKIVHGENPVILPRQRKGQVYVLTQADIDAIKLIATDEARTIAETIFDRMNTEHRKMLQDYSLEHEHADLTRPEPYFMLKRAVHHKKGAEDLIDSANMYQKGMDHAGITMHRIDSSEAIEIHDIFTAYMNYSWTVNNIVELGPAIKMANRVINNKEIHNTMVNSQYGSRLARRYSSVYNAMAADVVGTRSIRGPVDRGMRKLVSNVGKGILGINPKIAMYQPVSLIMAMREIEGTYLAEAISEGAMFDQGVNERKRLNPHIRMRTDWSAVGLVNEGGGQGKFILGFKARGQWPLALIRMSDNAAINIIWRAAELKVKAEGLDQSDVSRIAERVIKKTQPTFDNLHVSAIALEGKQSALAKIPTMFRSQVSKNLDILMQSTQEAMSGGGYERRRLAADLARVIISLLFIELISALYKATISGGDSWDSEKGWSDAMNRVLERLAGTVVFGDYIYNFGHRAVTGNWRRAPTNPVAGVVQDIVIDSGTTVNRAFTKGFDDPAFWDSATDALAAWGTRWGFPTAAPIRDIKLVIRGLDKKKKKKKTIRR